MSDCLRILQIGDIHLPQWNASNNSVDVKDSDFSSEITHDLTAEKLRSILKRIHEISTNEEIDCVLLMGDLTSYGKTEFIAPAVEIIDALVKQIDGKKPVTLGVPGNHDVDKVEAAELGKSGKFSTFLRAFRSHNWPTPPTEDCCVYPLKTANGNQLKTILLNTSIGSWSTHAFPAPLAEAFSRSKLSSPPLTSSDDDSSFELGGISGNLSHASENREYQLFSQMDTPYVSKAAVNTMSSSFAQMEESTAIIVAHHNLLPQKTPRIMPYGELLNGGYLRNLLLSSNKNIIYLHGHIHEDPIEIISAPGRSLLDHDPKKIISISAPEISDGFNEVTVFFNDVGDAYMTRITKYRTSDLNVVGNFSDQETKFIPLIREFNDLISGGGRKLWNQIKDAGLINWQEIVPKAAEMNISEEETEAIILKLFCCGLVNINQIGRPRTKWVMESLKQ